MDNDSRSFPSYKKIFIVVTAAASVAAYFAYKTFYKPKSNNDKNDYTTNIDQTGVKRHHL